MFLTTPNPSKGGEFDDSPPKEGNLMILLLWRGI
jgi:hypothetical protein